MINVKRIGHATFETPDLDRQIDYFTRIAGLVLAGARKRPRLSRDQGRRSRGPAREGRRVALRAACVPGRARRRLRRHPARDRGRGRALRDAQRSEPRHPEDAGVRGSEGHRVRGVHRADADRQEPAGRRHRADQARASRVRRRRSEGIRRLLLPRARLPGVGLDRRTCSCSCAAGPTITP